MITNWIEEDRTNPGSSGVTDKYLFNPEDVEGINAACSSYGVDVAVLTIEQIQAMLAGKVLVIPIKEYTAVILVRHE